MTTTARKPEAKPSGMPIASRKSMPNSRMSEIVPMSKASAPAAQRLPGEPGGGPGGGSSFVITSSGLISRSSEGSWTSGARFQS